jgi:hypothetical protein
MPNSTGTSSVIGVEPIEVARVLERMEALGELASDRGHYGQRDVLDEAMALIHKLWRFASTTPNRTLFRVDEHALSPWLAQADDFVFAAAPEGTFETIPVRTLQDGVFEICCIPFHAYNLDRGDRVTRDTSDAVDSIVAKSGDCGFRFKTDADEDTIVRIVSVLEKHGARVEFKPAGGLVAVNAPPGSDQELISGVLATFEDAGYLVYETIRLA